MNLLNANRKVGHSLDTVENLKARRAKAKNKDAWDKVHGDAMGLAKAQWERDLSDLYDLLKREGYFRWSE